MAEVKDEAPIEMVVCLFQDMSVWGEDAYFRLDSLDDTLLGCYMFQVTSKLTTARRLYYSVKSQRLVPGNAFTAREICNSFYEEGVNLTFTRILGPSGGDEEWWELTKGF